LAARVAGGLAALALAACGGGDGSGEPVARTGEAVNVCPSTVVEGVDVSDWDGTVDWGQVAASGRAFAFIKATQGNYDTQSTFAANWSDAKAAGLLRSPYHFFDATVDGVTQAQYFLSVLGAQGGLEPGDLPPMLDIECPTSSSETEATPCEGQVATGWAPTATIAQEAFDWLTTVAQATGRTPVIYSYPDWFAPWASPTPGSRSTPCTSPAPPRAPTSPRHGRPRCSGSTDRRGPCRGLATTPTWTASLARPRSSSLFRA
jgi:hypothetical protein